MAAVAASPGGASITLRSGEQRSGDLLVGCDGPGSLVRRTFLPDVASEYQARSGVEVGVGCGGCACSPPLLPALRSQPTC